MGGLAPEKEGVELPWQRFYTPHVHSFLTGIIISVVFSFTMCWDSEARFQICDYWMFDQVAFLQGPMTCGFAVSVAAAAVAAAGLAIAAAADAGLSVAFQSEPPFLPGLSGCTGPPA